MEISGWLIEKALFPLVAKAYSFCFEALRKRKMLGDGNWPVAKVNYQSEMVDVLSNYGGSIGDLPGILQSLLNQSGLDEHITDGLFTVNGTRFSTFFSFSDEENLLFYDRKESGMKGQQVENNRFDMFGARAFCNATLFTKIDNSFCTVKPKRIELIPGFCFEDTTEITNCHLRTTVVMLGFVVFVSKEDLKKARPALGARIEIRPIQHPPSPTAMTSKACLTISHLAKELAARCTQVTRVPGEGAEIVQFQGHG